MEKRIILRIRTFSDMTIILVTYMKSVQLFEVLGL